MEQPDNKKIYDDTWTDWVDMKIYGPASSWLRSLIIDHLKQLTAAGMPPIKTLLDVGCGEGTITGMLADKLPHTQVLGVDFSETGISCAQKAYQRPNLTFLLDRDERSETMNQCYDMVTAYEVLEHVDDWQDLLKKMAGASNRYLMLSFPTGRMRPFEVHVGHYRNYKKGQIEAYLKTQGFEPLSVFYAGFPFYNPLYRELCNLTDSGSNSFTRGKYGFSQKLLAHIIYFFFRHLSTKRIYGDQFCGLFVRVPQKVQGT